MNPEKIDCIAFPIQEEVFEDDGEDEVKVHIVNEGPFAHHEQLFPGSEVLIRHSDHRPLKGMYPSGGFSLSRWFEMQPDGDKLRHFHVDIYPDFDEKTAKLINERLRTTHGEARVEKAQSLRDLLPIIQICPERSLSLISSHKRYFSFKKGIFNVPPDQINAIKKTYLDRSTGSPILRFGVEVGDIVNDQTEEELRIIATGAIYTFDISEIKAKLSLPAATGTLTATKLSEIARLQVSLIEKNI